jgi:hypothetical protein
VNRSSKPPAVPRSCAKSFDKGCRCRFSWPFGLTSKQRMRDTLGSRRLSSGLFLLLSVLGFTSSFAGAQVAIPGMWRGNSVCTVKDSPCHDEQNVYRISTVPGKPGWFSVTASKMVNGKEIVMGTAD